MAKNERKYAVSVGQCFGALKTQKLVDVSCLASEMPDSSNRVWICECECGGTLLARSDDLVHGRVRQCNGCAPEKYDEPALLDLAGEKFGRLTVIKRLPPDVRNFSAMFWRPGYLVECTCGRRFVAGEKSLVSGFRTACKICDRRGWYD